VSDLFAQGHSREAIREALARDFAHDAPAVSGGGEAVSSPDFPALVRAEVSGALAEALKVIAEQRGQLADLRARIEALEAGNKNDHQPEDDALARNRPGGLRGLWLTLTRPRSIIR
jgi:hypothetical protein